MSKFDTYKLKESQRNKLGLYHDFTSGAESTSPKTNSEGVVDAMRGLSKYSKPKTPSQKPEGTC